jgi:integrase
VEIVKGVYGQATQMAFFNALRARSEVLAHLWYLGASTGYRVSDLLKMRVYELLTDEIRVVETKTGKTRIVKLPPKVLAKMQTYRDSHGLQPGDFLFYGKECVSPITRQHAHRVMRAVGKELGLESIGTHSMRKTYAYNVLLRTKSFDIVKVSLNHMYLSTTIMYLIDGLTALLPKTVRGGITPAQVVAIGLPG